MTKGHPKGEGLDGPSQILPRTNSNFTAIIAPAINIARLNTNSLRWHSWIARSPPKGQVAGSNPARGTKYKRVT